MFTDDLPRSRRQNMCTRAFNTLYNKYVRGALLEEPRECAPRLDSGGATNNKTGEPVVAMGGFEQATQT